MGGCCSGAKAPPKKGGTKPPEIEKKDEEDPQPAPGAEEEPQKEDQPAEGKEDPPAEAEAQGEGGDAADEEAAAPAAPAAGGDAQQTELVSTATADPIEYDADKLERTEEPEIFGETDWQALFALMKENAEASGKEISVRISRRDPEDSQANKFYMAEQVYGQAVEEKTPPQSIDLHVIRVKEALQLTADRFVQINEDLENTKQGGRITHNVGDGKNHLFKVICGQGTHSDEDGPKMKYAMKQWLIAANRDYTCSMHHGIFFVNFAVDPKE